MIVAAKKTTFDIAFRWRLITRRSWDNESRL
jgi:hypothetical protein